MKKVFKTALAVLFVLMLSVSCVSCSSGNPFQSFLKEVQKEENFKVSMVLYHDDFGKVTQTMYRDGNVTYYFANDLLDIDEYYEEIVDDYCITYQKNESGRWKKSISDQQSTTDSTFDDIWNMDNFERDKTNKNVYRQKKTVIFETMDDVVLTFEDDSAVVEGSMVFEGEKCDVKMVISDLGKIQLTLPTVS